MPHPLFRFTSSIVTDDSHQNTAITFVIKYYRFLRINNNFSQDLAD